MTLSGHNVKSFLFLGIIALIFAAGPESAAAADITRAEFSSDRQCLATAIYYESAREPTEGQMAVAQVILNRVRHPSYPKSICDVVLEGHTRRTGCQFSFTCDGALSRRPDPRLWQVALASADRMLAGEQIMGLEQALNYHADYVRPYWSGSLKRLRQIGRHIFYSPSKSGVPVGPWTSPATLAAAQPAPPTATTGTGTTALPDPALPFWGLDMSRMATAPDKSAQ